MFRAMQAVAIGMVALSTAMTAFAQDGQRQRNRVRASVEAARDALGLTTEQIDRILEIRRERPARGQSWEQIDAWRESQLARVQSVLSADQKARLAEFGEGGERAFAAMGAVVLGLTRVSRAPRTAGAGRAGAGRGRRGSSAGSSGSGGRGPGQGRGGPSRSQSDRGGGSGSGQGSTPQNRGDGADNRD